MLSCGGVARCCPAASTTPCRPVDDDIVSTPLSARHDIQHLLTASIIMATAIAMEGMCSSMAMSSGDSVITITIFIIQ